MKITFFGAAGTVTGSCTLIETDRARIFVDAGMFQGRSTTTHRNARLPRTKLNNIDAVVLTHAHLDHCGRLPVFTKRGLNCPIYATDATCDIARLVLSDAAHIQEEDARRETKRRTRQGKSSVVPLFTFSDVFEVLRRFERVEYSARFKVADGIEAVYHDAGHILGSAIVELFIQDGNTNQRIVFSGDLGATPQPIIDDPTELSQARLVVMESTYGDRRHRGPQDSIDELADIIATAKADGGKVLIPSFAVGRTQTLLYHFREFAEAGILGDMPVYLDSPMAIEATQIYERHRELYDPAAVSIKQAGRSPMMFPNLSVSQTADDSRSINRLEGPAIIIAGAGMCNGGRIVHHFLHHIWRENTHVVFVGFQAQGTLGRRIVDGARSVKVMGEPVRVCAQIHTVNGFSAHADQQQLLEWIANFEPSNPTVVLNHGEDWAREPLAARIKAETGLKTVFALESEPIEL